MIYQYYKEHDEPGRDTVTVAHKCGHSLVYRYGGTVDLEQSRREFAAEQQGALCPTCAITARVAECASLPRDIPVNSAAVGAGRLTTVSGKVVFVPAQPVIVKEYDRLRDSVPAHPLGYRVMAPAYSYVARVLAPGACDTSYLHRSDGHAYQPDELAWIDEYIIESTVNHNYDGRYGFGSTLKTWDQLHEAERRLGRRIALNGNDIDHAADARAEAAIASREAALELACETGLISGAASADI
jgi:hypothetical protein